MHCKAEDPCASGAPLEPCLACSSLREVKWNHLRTVFQERSAKHAAKTQLVEPKPDSEEEPESGEIHDLILDLNADEQPILTGTHYTFPTGVSAPTGLCPLQPATSSSGIQTFLQPAKVCSIPDCPGCNSIYHSLFQDAGSSSIYT